MRLVCDVKGSNSSQNIFCLSELLLKVRCNHRKTCKVKLPAQAYSISNCHDRWMVVDEDGICWAVIELFHRLVVDRHH